ncbi:uncharacterized protein LOC134684807 [Mytilus trossulus]|uniref:uncharacterized protein LOC134684807 n=1 Tax=Mytilus trossulus TaxID=6551 RepID=UPI003006FFA9
MANASMSNVSEFTSNYGVHISNKTTKIHAPRDGYDLPLFGLENHHFASLHLTALSCISISLTFSVFVLALSFRNSNHRFLSWTKSKRLVVYMAICDGVFNLTHSLEHLQIYITKDHVRPRELCMFYSFVIGEFISAQMFMVNAVSINVFSMIYMRKDIHLGKYDWKLLLYTFGHAAQSIKCVHKTARNMSLFVAVFFIKWFPLAVFSITALLGHIPEVIMYMAISFTNIGGVLNGLVFIIIKRRKEHHK